MAKRIVSALGKFSNSTVTGNDDTYKQVNIADYTIEKKKEGSYKLKRILFWVVAVIVLLAIVVLLLALQQYFAALAVIVFSVMILIALNFFAFRYLQIEYSYAIENAEFIATTIYGGKSDKLLLHTKMSSLDKIVPYEGSYKDEIDAMTFDEKIEMRSTPTTDQAYAVTYKTEDGKTGVVFLEACNKALKAFKYYHSQTTVMKEMRR